MDRVRPAMLIAALVVDVGRRLPRRGGSAVPEGGGSGRSHPENADPDQQVAKKDEAKYTLLVEWTNQQK